MLPILVKKNAPDMYCETLSGIPFGRMGKPEEVGDVVAFLLSGRASWVTGQTIAIDGAQNRYYDLKQSITPAYSRRLYSPM
jgi:NAD(P)-dependent dehydrogenase (short-subunit alcohol dehydrogenase family)